jgi:putative ABC transport system permease protein
MDRERIKFKNTLRFLWLCKMAWRDSRKNRSRLFLFISSITFGIAAIVAIYSFRNNLQKDADYQAATLLGADLVLTGNDTVSEKSKPIYDTLGDRRSQECSFASMVYFPKDSGTRLVQVRALQGGFPYYGSLETIPAKAGHSFQKDREALVDKTLMLQFNASVGDSVKLGEVTFVIAGSLEKAPRQTGLTSSIAPIVYIPLQYLQQTGLMKTGSQTNYSYYYKYDKAVDLNEVVNKLMPVLKREGMSYYTVATEKDNIGRFFRDLTRFLALVAFIALLLGCVGVASSIHVYVREKINSIAIMRCLGASASQAFFIYLIQILAIAFIGSVIGAFVGVLVQRVIPVVLKDFLPFKISVSISWSAVMQGVVLGLIISVLFALFPLISARKISPLNTLRISSEKTNILRDPFTWLICLLVLLFIAVYTYIQLGDVLRSIFFTVAIIFAFLILTAAAFALMWMIRIIIRNSWSYLWRQGFANLFRPNNQTIILIVSIGLSTAFISTIYFVQDMLIKRITFSASGNQPNMIVYDIQTSQEKQLASFTQQQRLPILQQVPIVTMRLQEINGKTAKDVKNDTTLPYSRWAFNSEYRITYRDYLTEPEKIIAGTWIGKADTTSEYVPISLEDRFAESIPAKIGDHLIFNVQGTLIPTVVKSLRDVDWNRIQTNFRVVFPTGVLEDAPQFHVLLTRVPSSQVSAKYQQAVVRQFPNVSIIDLGLVLATLDEVLDKIGYVIHFMTSFSVITGLIVLIASVRISKYQRMQESVLLRTLGASRKQMLAITIIEYFFLGALSALTGILIATGCSRLLAKYQFKFPFTPNLLPAGILFSIITIITVVIGLFNSREVLRKPPLEILRTEVD